jgi:hypothetical protein
MAASKYNTHQHTTERARLTPIIDAGDGYCTEPICIEPDRWIPPGTPWDLAHANQPDEYRGPAHAKCNRSEGGRRGHIASCRSAHHDHHAQVGADASQNW